MPEANEMAPSRDINRKAINKVWFQEPCRLPGSYHEAGLVVQDQLDVTDLHSLLVMEYQSEKEIVTYCGLGVKVRDRKKSPTWKSLSRIRFHSSKRPYHQTHLRPIEQNARKEKEIQLKPVMRRWTSSPTPKLEAPHSPLPTPQTCVFFI